MSNSFFKQTLKKKYFLLKKKKKINKTNNFTDISYYLKYQLLSRYLGFDKYKFTYVRFVCILFINFLNNKKLLFKERTVIKSVQSWELLNEITLITTA